MLIEKERKRHREFRSKFRCFEFDASSLFKCIIYPFTHSLIHIFYSKDENDVHCRQVAEKCKYIIKDLMNKVAVYKSTRLRGYV